MRRAAYYAGQAGLALIGTILWAGGYILAVLACSVAVWAFFAALNWLLGGL